MKLLKNSILVLSILFNYSCQKETELHISKTVVFDGKLYELNSEKPFSGIIYNMYPDSVLEYEGKYKNGKPNGLLTYWYNNGNKMREWKLKNGSPIGKWKYYNTDGTLQKTIDN